MIDLNEKRQEIIDVATQLFEKFINMPKDLRPDDKKRTGIRVVAWEPDTRNLAMVSIKYPSEASQFFAVEKAVRSVTNFHASSENSADENCMMFAGSVSVQMNEITGFENAKDSQLLVVSTSGLKAEEDVAVSLMVISKLIGLSVLDVCKNIDDNDGVLPEWYYDEDKSYLQFLFE